MRVARFDDNLVGVVLDDGIHDVTPVLSELPPYRYPLPGHDVLIANLAKLTGKLEQAARRAPGTPQGVAPVRPRGVMQASQERVGTMRVAVS